MAETAKPKPRKKSSPKKAASVATAESPPDAKPATPAEATEATPEQGKITPPEPPERRAIKRTGKHGGIWFLLVLLVLVGTGVGYLTWPGWQPYIAAALPNGLALTVKDPRVDAMIARMGQLESQAEVRRQNDPKIARLEDARLKLRDALAGALERIETLEGSIVAVKERAKPTVTAEDAARTSRALRALNERLAQLEGARASTPADAGNLAERMALLEQSSTRARADLSKTRTELNTSRTNLSTLEDRVRAVENRPAFNGDAASVIILAISNLRDAVHRGRAFTYELDAVRAAAGGNPTIIAALADIHPNAAVGIATLSALRAAFAARAGDIAAAGQGAQKTDQKTAQKTDPGADSNAAPNADPGANWLDRAAGQLSSLVRLRRIDGGGGETSTETLVSETEKHLAAGDLAAAIQSVEKLDGPAGATAAPWLARARARLAAEQGLANLHAFAVSLLTTPKG